MVSPRLLGALFVFLLLLATMMWLTMRHAAPVATTVSDIGGSGKAANAARPSPTFTVEMTAYTSAPAQTDGTPRLTASGAVAGPGTAAVSRDLLERIPYGSHVQVLSVSGEGCGGWVPETPLTVADTMNARIENHLDVWLETTEQALNWGRCRAEIRVVKVP